MKQAILAVACAAFLAMCAAQPEPPEDPIGREALSLYTESGGPVLSYPGRPASEQLSESLGLLMQYALAAGDRTLFAREVELLKERYLVSDGEDRWIRWEVGSSASANASIDDARIIRALDEAPPGYGGDPALASALQQTIARHQGQSGLIVDFYDWKYAQAAQRITLSYLTSDYAAAFGGEAAMKHLLERAGTEGAAFFPEYYDTAEQRYAAAAEVHMVDQMLIAGNRQARGVSSPAFLGWLKGEWRARGWIGGRYARASQQAAVEYESIAVYRFADQYLRAAGEDALAAQMRARAELLYEEADKQQLHFFDYVSLHLMRKEAAEHL